MVCLIPVKRTGDELPKRLVEGKGGEREVKDHCQAPDGEVLLPGPTSSHPGTSDLQRLRADEKHGQASQRGWRKDRCERVG
jgi:hypothetical protein